MAADYEQSIAEIRRLQAEIGNIERALHDIRSDVFVRGREFRELCEYLYDVVDGEVGFEIDRDQTALIFQAVKFTCVSMNLGAMQNKLEMLSEQN